MLMVVVAYSSATSFSIQRTTRRRVTDNHSHEPFFDRIYRVWVPSATTDTSKTVDIFIPARNIWVSFETSWNMMIQVVWHVTLQVSKCPRFGFLEPWEWRNYISSKRRELVIKWHSFSPQKTWTYIHTVVETANLSCKFQHWGHRTKYHGVYHDAPGFLLRHPFLH